MINDYLFKVRTDGDIIDLEGRVIGHINLEYIKSIAERPQGEWIEDYTETCHCFIGCHCSICNTDALEKNDYPYYSNFCPNCGAKMKGGAE